MHPDSSILAEWLINEGVRAVSLVPGMEIDPFLLQLAELPEVRTVVATHEGAAGFIADGYARASQRIGVCLGIGAPGASNMLTAAVTAQADDSPVLFITGNVPVHLDQTGTFQDGGPSGTNDVGLFGQAVRYAATVENPACLEEQLHLAAAAMHQLPFAPGHLSIPYDVQEAKPIRSSCPFKAERASLETEAENAAHLEQTLSVLARARNLVILAGGRTVLPDAAEPLRRFAEKFSIPVATTLAAKGVLPENHPLSLGNFGYAGMRRANEALLRPDVELLLILGADFNERDSLCWDHRLKSTGRTLVRIDPKKTDYRHGLEADIEWRADCASVLNQFLGLAEGRLASLRETAPTRQDWIEQLMAVPRAYPAPLSDASEVSSVPLDEVIQELRKSLPEDTNLIVDAGLQRVFAGHYWLALRPHSFFSACGLAPMGWAIGAAIGAKLARPDQPVVVVTGDGCMRTHGFEIATMARYGLPIIVVVCNNQAYGSIHRRFKSHRTAAQLTLLSPVDWPQFARALGAESTRASTPAELRAALEQAIQHGAARSSAPAKPWVIDVATPLTQGISNPAAAPAAILAVKKAAGIGKPKANEFH
jgi:acetolactate synthase-1/2/3 large subunit